MSTTPAAPDLLAAIVAATRGRVEAQAEREPRAALEVRAMAREPRGDRFRDALANRARINVIAECKRRSPSRGVLRAAYDAASIADGYARAGAAALSVLTEPMFFDGALDHLAAVRARVIPETTIAVSESGLRTAEDLRRMSDLGFRAFLIGERFMTTPDPGAALAELIGQLDRERERRA